MKILHKLYDNFNKYWLTILGMFLFSLYIYFRFIKERLPKTIPFEFTTLGFLITVEICIIFIIIILFLIRPPKKKNEIIHFFIDNIYKPLIEFDQSLKNIIFIKNNYPRILLNLISKNEYLFKTIYFDLIFFVFPRIILLLVFIIDIFFF